MHRIAWILVTGIVLSHPSPSEPAPLQLQALRQQRAAESADPEAWLDAQLRALFPGQGFESDKADPAFAETLKEFLLRELAKLQQELRPVVSVAEVEQWKKEIEQDPLNFMLRYTEPPSEEWLIVAREILGIMRKAHPRGDIYGLKVFFVRRHKPDEAFKNPLAVIAAHGTDELEATAPRIFSGHASEEPLQHFMVVDLKRGAHWLGPLYWMASALWHDNTHEGLRRRLAEGEASPETEVAEPGQMRWSLQNFLFHSFLYDLTFDTLRTPLWSRDPIHRERWRSMVEGEWRRLREEGLMDPYYDEHAKTDFLLWDVLGGYSPDFPWATLAQVITERHGNRELISFLFRGDPSAVEWILGPEIINGLNALIEFMYEAQEESDMEWLTRQLADALVEHGDFSGEVAVRVLKSFRTRFVPLHERIMAIADHRMGDALHGRLMALVTVDRFREWAQRMAKGQISIEALETEIHRLLPDSLAELPSSTAEPAFVATRMEYDPVASHTLANAL